LALTTGCSYNVPSAMSGIARKRWFFFVWDEDNIEHLESHGVRPEEAEEVFFNRYVITPNKRKHRRGRYRIDGRTNAGRRLRIIFEDLGGNIARIITGWEL
jgi:uncharacterized protein